MPYYLETDDRELLKRLRLTNVCAECGGRLEALYDLGKHLPYLQCKADPKHKDIAKEYQGEFIQPIIDRRENMEKEYGKEKTTALERLPTSGALTQPQAEHILSLVYPNVPKDEIIRCAILCRDFGLHPLMKEVYIIQFGKAWVTVIGINATRKMAAQRKGAYSFLDATPRAATSEEIVKQYGKDSEEERDNLISICKLKGERDNEATGFGLWPKETNPYGMDKGNSKRNMANIRSERQATDRLPGEALPQGVGVVDEAYVEMPEVGKVVKATGEIIKGEAIEAEAREQVAMERLTGVGEEELEPEIPYEDEAKLALHEAEPTPVSEPVETRDTTEPKPTDTPDVAPAPAPAPPPEGGVDIPWLIDSVNTLKWDILKHIKETFQVSTQGSLKDVVARLSREQQEEVCKAVQERLDLKGT